VREPGSVHLGVFVAESHQASLQAGRVLQDLAPLVDGRGGGKAGLARGAGSRPEGIPTLLEKAREILAPQHVKAQ
jgi:alanyl-tRNA synthetase